jgi:flagellar protein FliL
MAEKIPAIAVPPTVVVQSAPAPPPTAIIQRKSSFSTIALIVIVTLAGGGGGVWFIQERGQADAAASAASGKSSATVIHLDGFTVNLADPEENHFLRVTMELAIEHMPPPLEREKPNSGLPMARIRDTILSVLTVGKADVLLTPEGKENLKKNLLDALNRENPELGVREIYFTEFLVQR